MSLSGSLERCRLVLSLRMFSFASFSCFKQKTEFYNNGRPLLSSIGLSIFLEKKKMKCRFNIMRRQDPI